MTFNTTIANERISTIIALDVQIASLQAERDIHVQALRTAAPDTGKFTFDAGSVTVSADNTYEESVIRSLLNPGQVKRCEVRKLDKSVVKALYPDVYAAAKRERGRKVSVTR